jgi:hypothetical protein
LSLLAGRDLKHAKSNSSTLNSENDYKKGNSKQQGQNIICGCFE